MPAKMQIALMLLSLSVFGCGGPQYALSGSARVPGAHGAIQVEKADEGKLLVTVILDELSPPSHLGDEYTSYVLWFQPEDADPVQKGPLKYDPKQRRGKATATADQRSFDLSVTAEASPDATEPGVIVVAKQQIRED